MPLNAALVLLIVSAVLQGCGFHIVAALVLGVAAVSALAQMARG
jgi:hypothetical protein